MEVESVTCSPSQSVSGPAGVITGVFGTGFSVTVTGDEVADGHPATVEVTVNVPAAFTVIEGVVAPVDHRLLVPEEVSTVLSPGQMSREGFAVITGAGGVGLTVTAIGALTAEHPLPFV